MRTIEQTGMAWPPVVNGRNCHAIAADANASPAFGALISWACAVVTAPVASMQTLIQADVFVAPGTASTSDFPSAGSSGPSRSPPMRRASSDDEDHHKRLP